jgi:DNA transformation protein
MVTDEFQIFISDQLSELKGLCMKRMFGAVGMYLDGVFFGILDDGRLFFKTSVSTREKYVAAGCGPFTYEKKGKGGSPAQTVALKSYYEVPIDVLETRSDLVRWAREAAAILTAIR